MFNGIEQLKGLQIAAQWTAKGLQIDSAKVEREDLSVNLSGLLQPNGDWPLALQGTINLPSPDKQPWALALNVEGDLRTTLNLTADSSGYLNAHLKGDIQPLAENLPAQVSITSEAFKASPDLPDTLQLNQLLLTAKGDLKAGSKAKLEVIREGKRQTVELTVGAIPEEGATLDALGNAKSGAERSSNRLGIAVVELTDEQKKSFDLKSGVVIKEVQDGPASLIGLQPGDVITHLNNQAIDSTKQFTDIAKALPKNRSVSMRVLRQGRASFITFKLAE